MILDTCALLWLAGGNPGQISEDTLNLINKAPTVSIIAITGFEIGIKCRVGKLILPVKPQKWIDSILEFHKIGIINLDLGICIRAAELPPIHKDPCDRLIIASALMNNLPVVTADKHFVEYGVNVLS
jgi:PIN domain nuclease of toxin-antitoxin system